MTAKQLFQAACDEALALLRDVPVEKVLHASIMKRLRRSDGRWCNSSSC
jgi:hypothetical protein